MVPKAASAAGITRSACAGSSATTTSSAGTAVFSRTAHSRVVGVCGGNITSVSMASAQRAALGVGIERVDRLAGADQQAVALGAAEAEVGRALRQEDVPDHLALGVEDRHAVVALAATPAAPEVAVGVHAEPIGHALAAVDEHPAVLHLVPDNVEGADLARHRAADDDVERALVGREGEAVRARDVA